MVCQRSRKCIWQFWESGRKVNQLSKCNCNANTKYKYKYKHKYKHKYKIQIQLHLAVLGKREKGQSTLRVQLQLSVRSKLQPASRSAPPEMHNFVMHNQITVDTAHNQIRIFSGSRKIFRLNPGFQYLPPPSKESTTGCKPMILSLVLVQVTHSVVVWWCVQVTWP